MAEKLSMKDLPKRLIECRDIRPNGCWEWTGSHTGNGYGGCSFMGERWTCHRLAWTVTNGPIPDDMNVLHNCDNRLCFNPAHLRLGTQGDNIREAYAKGRMFRQQHSEEFLSMPSEPIVGRPVLLNDLFDKYIKECIPELALRSQRDYRGIIEVLRKSFGHIEPKDVKPRQVVEFLDVDKGRVHRNRMVTILSTVYHKAIGKWCIGDDLRNPCVGVEKWPTQPRTRYVTTDEYDRFRAICRPQVQIAMDLALLTGQRQGDIIGLKWDRIKTGDGLPSERWHIEIDQGKTGKKLAIRISDAVEKVLDRAWLMEPRGPYVIRTSNTGERYTEDGFRAMWQRYCRAWEAAGNPRFHFHDLRAKSISDNADFDAAYLLAGHIDPKMTRRTYDRNRRLVEPLR